MSGRDIRGPLHYSFGTLHVDANARGAVRFEYVARRDCGCLGRHGAFSLAPTSTFPGGAADRDMQQFTGKTYPKYCLSPTRDGAAWSTEGLSAREIRDQCVQTAAYDRGHMIPANHFDHDAETIKQTNYMINIVPQVARMNRGAWLETEMIVECLRDQEVLRVVGGAVYPGADSNYAPREWFRKTHGVTTPAYFWKVIVADPAGRYAEDNGLIAFWVPNSADAVASATADYVVSLRQLEANLANHGGVVESFTVSESVKDHVPNYWGVLEGCDRA